MTTCQDLGVPKLLAAVRLGEFQRINRLLDDGVSVDAADDTGKTALMMASHEGLPGTMELLLARDARVDLTCSTGNTALHWAVETHDIAPDEKCLMLLVERGACVDAKNYQGQTPLLKCALAAVEHCQRYTDVGDYCAAMMVLMAHGADIGVGDEQGRNVREIMEAHPQAFVPSQARRLISMIEGDSLQARTQGGQRSTGARRI